MAGSWFGSCLCLFQVRSLAGREGARVAIKGREACGSFILPEPPTTRVALGGRTLLTWFLGRGQAEPAEPRWASPGPPSGGDSRCEGLRCVYLRGWTGLGSAI